MRYDTCLPVRFSLLLLLSTVIAAAVINERAEQECHQTKVLILGAGAAGITAAQALSNQSIHDFIIVEYNGVIGGRVAHTDFGTKADGSPYVVELGANWVQGLGSPGGPENPIWTLAKKYNVTNEYSNYSSILTYNETGFADYSDLFDTYDDAYSTLEQDAGYILTESLLDTNVMTGLTLAGWEPHTDPAYQAIDWWEWDFEDAWSPAESSQLYGIAGYNATRYQYSVEDNYVFDQSGFNAFIKGEASTFLAPSDPRLQLSTIVTNVSHSDKDVTVHTKNGTCIKAEYAICTFSVGVLQAAHAGVAPVAFDPPFPRWKQQAIAAWDMGLYTKVFLQFPTQFWPNDTQYLLYASPTTRGYYPIFQSLSLPSFLPDSNILFVTTVTPQSRILESQPDHVTQAQVMAVLRKMFPDTTVPEPTAFMYPRWGQTEWAYGSYSNWPTGVTLEQHQNLRANVGRLWFAGEATSAEYYGFLQGAWFEGRNAGEAVGACVKGKGGKDCRAEKRYEVLKGTTNVSEYAAVNGWDVSTFLTYGVEDS